MTFNSSLLIYNPNGNLNLLNFSSRRINVIIDIYTGTSLKLLDPFLLISNDKTFDIVNITLNNTDEQNSFSEVNKDNDFFKISNKLHLLTPFPTSYNDMIITQNMQNAFNEKLKTDIRTTNSIGSVNSGLCFGIPNASSQTNQNDCKTFGGIWDTPPITNFDCPFYKKNSNYPNEFGGIVATTNGNYCQMPLGIKQTSFKTFDKNSTPICTNCKNIIGNIGNCCADQTNILTYPNLKSPDYIFK